MTGDRFERLLRDAAQDYHRPPETPREDMWRQIVEARARRRMLVQRRWPYWGLGIAAVLALGIGIGRWSARGPQGTETAAGRVANEPETLAYRVAAAQYLSRTEALLTGFRTEA